MSETLKGNRYVCVRRTQESAKGKKKLIFVLTGAGLAHSKFSQAYAFKSHVSHNLDLAWFWMNAFLNKRFLLVQLRRAFDKQLQMSDLRGLNADRYRL